MNMVTPAYFETFGIKRLRGRAFDDRDRAGSARVVDRQRVARAVSISVASIRWGSACCSRHSQSSLEPPPAPVEWEIVGVSAMFPTAAAEEPGPEILVPFWQAPWAQTTMAIRTAGDAAGVQRGVSEILNRLDPDLPMADVRTMEQVVSELLAADRFHTCSSAPLRPSHCVLAAVGIYGVMSFVVAQRTHEIGLRMALGAGRGQVLAQVLREGMTTALAGTGVGAAGAFFVGRMMTGLVTAWIQPIRPLPRSRADPALRSALACVVPARRAASVDPMVALRHD